MASRTLGNQEQTGAAQSVPAAEPRLPTEPMDPRLTSIQPGGGIIIRAELAWGRLRRWYLKTLRPRYVLRMQATRRGNFNGCPHPVLDPRDLKFHRNQGGYEWLAQDDPFAWRGRLPFARDGLAELLIMGGGCGVGAIVFLWLAIEASLPRWLAVPCWLIAAGLAVVAALVVWFFRDPHREIPVEAGAVLAPADGTIVGVDEICDDEFVPGRAVRIGIFLSIFNVHVNRMPIAARVIGLHYRPGKLLSALRPESARENEQLAVRIQSTAFPYRRMVVRQIAGQFARRIVCWLKPGDELAVGERFGMIKLGSRTELVLPCEAGIEISAKKGDKVRAGSTVLARYRSFPAGDETS